MDVACLKGSRRQVADRGAWGVVTELLANLLTQIVGAAEHKAKASQLLQL